MHTFNGKMYTNDIQEWQEFRHPFLLPIKLNKRRGLMKWHMQQKNYCILIRNSKNIFLLG